MTNIAGNPSDKSIYRNISSSKKSSELEIFQNPPMSSASGKDLAREKVLDIGDVIEPKTLGSKNPQDMWRIYSRTRGFTGLDSERMENISWRMMSMQHNAQKSRRKSDKDEGIKSPPTEAQMPSLNVKSIHPDLPYFPDTNFLLEDFPIIQPDETSFVGSSSLNLPYMPRADEFGLGEHNKGDIAKLESKPAPSGNSFASSDNYHKSWMSGTSDTYPKPSIPLSSTVGTCPYCHYCGANQSAVWHRSLNTPITVILCHSCLRKFASISQNS